MAGAFTDRNGGRGFASLGATWDGGGRCRFDLTVELRKNFVLDIVEGIENDFELALGHGVHCRLTGLGHHCMVVAPSHVAKKNGVRVKNDQRDAISLARLYSAGELKTVWVPDAAHEAIRDLVRVRTAAMENVRRARQQVKSFLLRHGCTFPGKTTWTKTYVEWIRLLKFEHPAHYIVIQEMLASVRDCVDRQNRLEQQIVELLPSWSLGAVVDAIQAMRGIKLVTAVIVVSEIGDFGRFDILRSRRRGKSRPPRLSIEMVSTSVSSRRAYRACPRG